MEAIKQSVRKMPDSPLMYRERLSNILDESQQEAVMEVLRTAINAHLEAVVLFPAKFKATDSLNVGGLLYARGYNDAVTKSRYLVEVFKW